MKPVFAALRERGFIITSFIDDILICNSSLPGCLTVITDTINTLRQLSFSIKEDQSVLVATKHNEYLGNIIDMKTMNISLPAHRVDKMVKGCKELMCKSKEKIQEVARITGLLMAAIPVVELGKLHYRKLEDPKIAALHKVNRDFDQFMTITDDMKSDPS